RSPFRAASADCSSAGRAGLHAASAATVRPPATSQRTTGGGSMEAPGARRPAGVPGDSTPGVRSQRQKKRPPRASPASPPLRRLDREAVIRGEGGRYPSPAHSAHARSWTRSCLGPVSLTVVGPAVVAPGPPTPCLGTNSSPTGDARRTV